jgi:hypothetical protein
MPCWCDFLLSDYACNLARNSKMTVTDFENQYLAIAPS